MTPPIDKAIVVEDSFAGYRLDQFCVPEHYRPDLQSVLLPHGLIQSRTEKLAADIFETYDFKGGDRLQLLCVLKGGHEFFSELITYLKRHLQQGCSHVPIGFDFIRVKSYDGMNSTGKASIDATGTDLADLAGKHVLVVEDIIDTGHTMSLLVPYLQSFGASSVRVATLLQKRTPKSCGFLGDFIGFSIPDLFVVGYCLDYNEIFRDMSHVCVMSAHGIKAHADGPDKKKAKTSE